MYAGPSARPLINRLTTRYTPGPGGRCRAVHSAAPIAASGTRPHCDGWVPKYRLRLAALVVLAVLMLLAWIHPAAAATVAGWRGPLASVQVTRPFEAPPTPYAAGHRGVDLAAEPGEPVVAAAGGVVSYAGPLAGRGVVVVVHGALRTTYEPVRASVRRGQNVALGTRLGVVEAGHPGCPVSACLHWGLRRGDQYLDPMRLLTPARVRLLPLTGSTGPAPALRSVGGEPAFARAGPAAADAAWIPSPVALSLAAVAGGGVILAFRRR